ncbi:MAG: MATE family efflux transporter [Eubacteriales bacterium]|nr:MATE family efflux transporter [Eubacteriales bacterium]
MKYDSIYFRSLLAIAIPVVLQNLVGALLNMVDNVMVGGLGETAMAAVGIANQIFFIFTIVLFGLTSGLSVYIAQFWGSKMTSEIRKTIALGTVLCLAFSLTFAAVAMSVPHVLIGIFTNDAQVIELGSKYLFIVALGYPLTAVSMVYSVGMRSTENAVFPLFSSVISLLGNTLLNYLLIYGKAGFPELGVRGAAIATVAARSLEFAMIIAIVYIKKLAVAFQHEDFRNIGKTFVRSIFKLALPVTLNESLWVLGVSVFSAVYGRMGTSELAAYNIVSTLERLSFVAILGLGNACAVLVGKQIGEKNREKAFDYSLRSIIIAPVMGLFITGILLLIRYPVVSLYDISETVRNYALSLIVMTALAAPFKALNYTNFIGVLRAGGDTGFVLVIDVGPLLLVAVPLAVFTGLYMGFPLPYVYAVVLSEELIKTISGLFRFFSRKWMNDVTVSVGDADVVEAVADLR